MQGARAGDRPGQGLCSPWRLSPERPESRQPGSAPGGAPWHRAGRVHMVTCPCHTREFQPIVLLDSGSEACTWDHRGAQPGPEASRSGLGHAGKTLLRREALLIPCEAGRRGGPQGLTLAAD